MTLPASVRINAQFPFPSLVQGSGPITVTKAAGIWTIGILTSALSQLILSLGYIASFSGQTTVNFGAFPGASDVQTNVTGQTGISSTSSVQVWIAPVATADHSADEHWINPPRVYAGNVITGVGFTIYAVNDDRINGIDGTNPAVGPGSANASVGNALTYGQWTVGWRWQ